ncbi:MAG: glycosyltransferase family 4 protein [Actinobacteria bacterium]|nr:MAG: glycosyltransferase family 4 protein [Actinomycetota bacterium]TMM08693.1 MAG: glycosyltransferase family 4 protein [Actinomycetota bacterium]
MRILYIDSKFGSPRASSHARVYHFAQRLLERGHEVTIIGRDSGRMQLEGEKHRGMVTRGRLDGLDVVLLKVPYAQAFSKRMRMLSYGGFTLGAGLLAATAGPADVVFASSSPLTIGISGVLASRLRRTPFVFELQDLWPAVPIGMGFLTGRSEIRTAEWLERNLYRAARRIVVCSDEVRHVLVERGIPAEKIVLIPNVSDVEHFNPEIADPSFRQRHGLDARFVAVYAGAMGVTNGIDQLVDAAVALRETGEDGVAIVAAGNGTEKERIERRVAELGLENMIVLPDIPRAEIPLLVGTADVTLTSFAPFPILQTNSPNKFFDSLAAGKPAVVNLDGWLRRLVEKNRVGVYVPAGDGNALADTLADLAGRPELVREMGRNARALAEREFSRDLLADRLADVLEDVVADPRPTSTPARA